MLEQEAAQKTWAVYADGELGGMISFQRISPWLGTAHCLFKSDFQALSRRSSGRRRPSIARAACKLAVAEMFATGIGKLEFYPLAAADGAGGAIGSLVTSLGAKREGTLRGHTLQHGKPIDINMYGLTKTEFEKVTNNAGRHSSGDADFQRDRSGGERGGERPVGTGQEQHVQQHPDAIA
jgi:RimJ/RimL family protein N-acetyltransferase